LFPEKKLHGGSSHLEQSVFADELSAESIDTLRPLITMQWQALRDAMVPVITALIEADKSAGRTQEQRVRIGLYSFSETTANNGIPSNKPSSRPKRKSTSKGKPI